MTDSVEISMLAKFYVNTTYTSKDTRRQKLGKTALFHVLNKTPVLTFCRMHAMGQPHLQFWGTRVLDTYNKSDFSQCKILNSVLPIFYQKREKRSFKACENGAFWRNACFMKMSISQQPLMLQTWFTCPRVQKKTRNLNMASVGRWKSQVLL